jgi:hypothetical protein
MSLARSGPGATAAAAAGFFAEPLDAAGVAGFFAPT